MIKVIRPSAHDVIVFALRTAPTLDGEDMANHVHLLTVAEAILDAFASEGIDLDALVADAIDAQKVTIS